MQKYLWDPLIESVGIYSWDCGRKIKVKDKDLGVTDMEVVDATSEYGIAKE